MDGLLLVDKPSGPTSHDVVARMRRTLGEKRIGHTGTLDPAATGLLVLVLGKATRLAKFLSASAKSYEAVVRLGFPTDTADAQGQPIGPVYDGALPSREAIDTALDAFRGPFMQQPPAFSAKKIDGQRSYKLARARGRESFAVSAYPPPVDSVDPGTQKLQTTPDPLPAPTSVMVSRLEIVSIEADRVTLSLDCSAGFYVRSLAHDLGARLGTGGHLAALRRTRSGDFTLDRAIPLETAERDRDLALAAVIPLAQMLPGLPAVVLTPDGLRRASHGQNLGPEDGVRGAALEMWRAGSSVRLLDPAGTLVGIAEQSAVPGLLHPSIVLV